MARDRDLMSELTPTRGPDHMQVIGGLEPGAIESGRSRRASCSQRFETLSRKRRRDDDSLLLVSCRGLSTARNTSLLPIFKRVMSDATLPPFLRQVYNVRSEDGACSVYTDNGRSRDHHLCSREKDKPYVTLTFAQSLDAKIAGRGGKQLTLSGKESMVMTHWYAPYGL